MKNGFSIVIPCFNEEIGMPKTVNDIFNNVKGKYEIIIVDDCSSDRTLEKARAIEKSNDNVRVFSHKINLGKRLAVDTGIKKSVNDTIVLIDGDYTYPAAFINPLLKKFFGGAEMAYGSRFIKGKTALSLSHFLGNKMFSFVFSFLTSRKITDLTSGLRVFSGKKYFSLNLKNPRFGMETELMMKAFRSGWSFAEIPISLRKRSGKSKISALRDGPKIFFMLFHERFF